MNAYYGTKQILAKPMTQHEFNVYMGNVTATNLPDNSPKGYLVEYLDSPNANHPEHDNYVSWSPADVFERAYQPTTAMAFGHAVEAMKAGQAVARSGWNGKNMFISLVELSDLNRRDYIEMHTAQGDVVPWVASQSDILAHDWYIIE
jgi:hypothetical protein